ncbi:helix-turn-helix domain-containing protein [Clostridium botulinum]|uniref:helix-turn-helix domain-containing protein n=1 Tax=Clostridium botulinum TaxID=1491 RepID=UPI001FA7A762|nr:helix-turn-helix transcriptional regulator [Clostridium botulinum]
MLYEKRILANITQANLAEKCNISQSYISRLERNLKSPNLKIIENLSNALEINPLELFKIIEY